MAVKYYDIDGQVSANIFLLELKLELREPVYYFKDNLVSIKATVGDTGEIVGYDNLDAYGNLLYGRIWDSLHRSMGLNFIFFDYGYNTI